MARSWLACECALVVFLLSGCSYDVLHYSGQTKQNYSSNNAKVSSIPSAGYHRVQSGETLFSIAFRYGLDYRELARLNNIGSSYVIYPTQKIYLKGQKLSSSVASTTPPKTTKKSIVKKPQVSTQGAVTASVNMQEKAQQSDTKVNKPIEKWSWPVDGQVVRGFSNAGVSSKGIDIKAQEGALVKVAADGTVVYAGNGLIGYGNLVIVKHSDVYLSAYAYNERILVKEQQNVKMGDSLAVIGGKGEDRPLLHFEVRRDGQPINPEHVLPQKK